MTDEKPVKYKKMFRDALAALNEKLNLNIPDSEIGALARETYHGGQTRTEPLDGKEYHVMNRSVIEEYHKQLAILQKQAQNRWDLKVLAVINERTGRNLPPEAAEKIRERRSFPGCNGWDDQVQMYYLYKKISEELENAGRMTKEARLLAEGKKVCGRCGGSGRYSWNPRTLDQCFSCLGSGIVPIKKKEGKGWHEDTPGHKRAAAKSKLKNTLRQPIVPEYQCPNCGAMKTIFPVWHGHRRLYRCVECQKEYSSNTLDKAWGRDSNKQPNPLSIVGEV